MELVALVVGLVAAAVVLPALLLLCGTKRKEAPVGASMANRRGGPSGGPLQIDPILHPNWAAKQAAAREAADKKQLSLIMSSKQARLHRAGGGGNAADDVAMRHLVMRQPSTMADKFALPSHLTKQLGQPSRRNALAGGSMIRTGTPVQDGSVDGVPVAMPDRKSLSPPLARPELAYTSGSLSASISRSAVNDSSINVRTSAGEVPPEVLLARTLNNSNTSNGSRRALAASPPVVISGPRARAESPSCATVIPVSEMYPEDASVGGGGVGGGGASALPPRGVSGAFARGSGSGVGAGAGTGIAWPGLNDVDVSSSVQRQLSQQTSAIGIPGRSSQDGPRASCPHPRVAALSPLPPGAASAGRSVGGGGGSGSRAASGDGSHRNSRLLPGPGAGAGAAAGTGAFQRLEEEEEEAEGKQVFREEDGENLLQPSSSDFVERLTAGVDWSAAPLGSESARRASYALGTTFGTSPGITAPALVFPSRQQSSAPTTSESGTRPHVAGGGAAAASGVSYRCLQVGGRSAGGRTISSRELHGRSMPHLPSPLGGRPSMLERDAPGSASGGSRNASGVGVGFGGAVSKRWTANGGLSTPPAPSLSSAVGLDGAQLPGSAECVPPLVVMGPEPIAGFPVSGNRITGAGVAPALIARSHRSLILLREAGGSGNNISSGGGGGAGIDSLEEASGHRSLGLGLSFGAERATADAVATAAAAAAAASVAAAAAAGHSGGGITPPIGGAGRTTATWSGMAAAPLVDVEAGPGAAMRLGMGMALTSAGDDGLPGGAAAHGSRAARAQALLARNRTALSRLGMGLTTAAAAAPADGGRDLNSAPDVEP